MAFNPAPSSWLASWSEDGTSITVPIATFPELTAAEADGTTGDIRKIAFALAEKLYQAYNGTAAADRPTKMTITRASSVNDTTGDVTRTYTFRFTLVNTATEVKAES